MTQDLDHIGPIDYLVIEFPADEQPDGTALGILLDLAERGIIRVLDLAFLRKDADGGIVGLNISETGLTGEFDVTLFAEASSGLLDDDDIGEAAGAVEPGRVAAVLVYENTWAAPFARAIRHHRGDLVASGRIPVQAILATLDQLEATD